MIIRTRHRAFTLIEILVVVGIIALLVSILLPSLARAREQAKSTMCRAGLKQLALGTIEYVHDNKLLPATSSVFYENSLAGVFNHPGCYPVPRNTNLKQTNWFWDGTSEGIYTGPNDPNFIADCPKRGTIFKYARDEKLFLCPSDQPGAANGTAAGGGGNGRGSYSMNGYIGYINPDRMSGTAIDRKNSNMRFTKHWSPSQMFLFVEEHPYWHKNSNVDDTNGTLKAIAWGFEGNFNVTDKISTRHNVSVGSMYSTKSSPGRSNMSYVDGHVESVLFQGLTSANDLFDKINMPESTQLSYSTIVQPFEKEFMHDIGKVPF